MAQFLTKKDGKDYLVTDTMENRQKAAAKGLPVYDKLLDPEGNEAWINQNISAKAIREKGYKVPEAAFGEQETLKGLQKKTAYGPIATGVMAAADVASFGLGTPASGFVDYLGNVISGKPANLQKSLEARELQKQLAFAESPKSAIAGTLLGALASPGLGVLGAGAKASALAKIGSAAGLGATEAALSTVPEYIANPLEKTPEQLAEQTKTAALFGFAGGAAGGTIAARSQIAKGIRDVKGKGTEALERLIKKEDRAPGAAAESLAPEDLTARDLAEIAVKEPEAPPSKSFLSSIPKIGEYVSQLEQWAARKQGVSKAKQQLADIQKVIKEDKKLFLSEIQDELERRLFNGKNLDDLTADEIANLEPSLVVSVQEQLNKIEKDLNQFTNQEYITSRLRMPSAEVTPLKKYIAEMGMGGEGGYGEAVRTYEEVLRLGPERRAQAQAFDVEEKGAELFPFFERAEKELSQGVSETMDVLTDEAKQAYRFLDVREEDIAPDLLAEMRAFTNAINDRKLLIEQAKKSPARYKEVKALEQEVKDLTTRRLSLENQAKKQVQARSQEYIEAGKDWFNKISSIRDDLRKAQAKRGEKGLSNAEKALNEGLSYVESGGGPSTYGFTDLNYTDPRLSDAERFSRLWKMRQILDDNINWVKYEKGGNLSDDERFLIQARSNIKDELRKYSKAFESSDRIYSMFSDIKEKVFGKGKKPVDRFTLGRMLQDTDTAKRYGEYLKDLRALAVDPLISAERRTQIQSFLDEFDKLKLLAKDKQSVAAWEKIYGPTGQGVQKAIADAKRLATAVGESSTIGRLFAEPGKFAKIDQNFVPKINLLTGKPTIKDLATDELLALTRTNNKYQKAMSAKESITDERLKAFYDEELSKIRSKSTPPEPPKGGFELPKEPVVGLGIQGGKLSNRVSEGIKNYALNRLTTMGINEAAKGAGLEEGINVFEPYKDDLKAYLISEYGIPERVADIAVGVLPNNPVELMNTVKGIRKSQMGDVIKFPVKPKPERTAQFYIDRGRGPFDDEILDWVEDIKKLPKQKQPEAARELLRSNLRGEAKEYGYAKDLLEKNNIKIAPDDKTDFDRMAQAFEELDKLAVNKKQFKDPVKQQLEAEYLTKKETSKKDLYKEVYVNPDEYTANYNPEFTISSESLPKPSRNGGFVYRIEDDKGLGPWHGGPKGKEAQWWMDDPSSQKKLGALDDPKLRALSDVIEDSEQSGQLLFAFNSLNQLKKHISPTEIKRLKDAGFSIKKIKADEVWEGQNEVVFTPDTGKWQGERKYRSDDEDY